MGMIAGIDEAGRGPVLGPMVMAIVACKKSDVDFLNKIGVKDSKLLTPNKRVKLARIIKQKLPHAIIKVSPQEIDRAVRNEKTSLNTLEADVSGKLIRRITQKVSVSQIILDLPSKNKKEYVDRVRKKLSFPENAIPIKAEFKADLNYVQVAAASILAKVARDAAIKSLEKKLKLILGSGYTSDHITIKSLHDNFNKLVKEKLVRTSWKTVAELLEERRQTKLSNF